MNELVSARFHHEDHGQQEEDGGGLHREGKQFGSSGLKGTDHRLYMGGPRDRYRYLWIILDLAVTP